MSCTDKSIAVYHITGADTIANGGTLITIPDEDMWKTITAINDTDQDIKITFKNVDGDDHAFIVPKSIKGFTKVCRKAISNTSMRATSLAAAAVGNISINLGI